jgi:hypothetical protein
MPDTMLLYMVLLWCRADFVQVTPAISSARVRVRTLRQLLHAGHEAWCAMAHPRTPAQSQTLTPTLTLTL